MADPWNDRTLQTISSHMIRANYDWVASLSLLNTATFGYNYFLNPFQGYYANQGWAATGFRKTWKVPW